MTKKVLISKEDILLIKGGDNMEEALKSLDGCGLDSVNLTHIEGFVKGFKYCKHAVYQFLSKQEEVKDEKSTD